MTVDRIIARDVRITDPFTLEVRFEHPARLSRFLFEDRFRARYTVPIDSVPEPLLVIPFLTSILPLAWLFDTIVEVDSVDTVFAESAQEVRGGLASLYPSLSFAGGLHARRTESAPPPSRERAAMLFSGGLDSVATYALHAEEHPLLISVNSTATDLEPGEAWPPIQRDVEEFARLNCTSSLVVTSNLRRMLNARALDTRFRRAFNNWWGGIQHSFGMAGLCASLSSAVGFSRLYIASTHATAMPFPWGSHPFVDNAIRWSGFRAAHDAYELTRQDKMRVFGQFTERLGVDLSLHVCDQPRSGQNCGQCEKCCRTMTGLVLQGHDPMRHGFPPLVPHHIKEQLASGSWRISQGIEYLWTDLQEPARTALIADAPSKTVLAQSEYVAWLANADFGVFRKRSGRNLRRRVRFVLGFLPKQALPALEWLRRAMGRA
ncbi:MAG: hypothetical protein Q8K89_08440 [Actinomycetota bacterium]|nr:hypothetical protein [Actinomycetota bacterium]